MTAALVLLIVTALSCVVACTLDDADTSLFDPDPDNE